MFRVEASENHRNRLYGDVAIMVPVAWQSIGLLIFGGVAAGVTFLSLASYNRVETVAGIIIPDTGISIIMPSRAGVIMALSVRDGQNVPVGAELAAIRAEEDGTTAFSPAALIESAIARQDANLAAQSDAAQASARAQTSQLAAQRSGVAAEIVQLQSQITTQRALIASAQKDLDRARTIADRGFISGRDLQVREETLLARQQGLSQLEQSLAAKHATLTENERTAAQISAQARIQIASLSATRAQVAQQAASAAGARSYVLRAPVAGRVTALTARVGQPVNPQGQLMTIIPDGAKLRAELAVPSAAIGFVKSGQQVRLAIDAFPYQRFGTVTGEVQTVSASAVNSQGPNGTTISVYPVTVAIDQASMSAYGRSEPLVSGMTLAARIITEKQSLLQWLFEPLFAVQQR
ncbi:MAG: HlyD family efflux transporter periplasmic adaptor subunit [Sphingorhabdus sp.]|uniref:HlyD family efflux transporter periplasmic adaptor subunit n=1 Tax=Sphingorhabdus sp. TaxID=1902408 RepID=UPI0025FC8D33|nr:HlyD family efflux transporter periplasmic adaptor subunit [Sphingorhabdus sp.]MCO4092880.1 HlyD family efflux transporter periplasmic adaptor subunit [Sphingorhabdus sp.]